MGPIGLPEMMAIFTIALLLFGPKKLPELGRTLGKALSEFRRAKNELKTTFESHLQELERETRIDTQPKYLGGSGSSDTDYSANRYSYSYDENRYDPSSYSSTNSASETTTTESTMEERPSIAAGDSVPSTAALEPAAPVEGTVPRSNGTHASVAATAAVEEGLSPDGEHHA